MGPSVIRTVSGVIVTAMTIYSLMIVGKHLLQIGSWELLLVF